MSKSHARMHGLPDVQSRTSLLGRSANQPFVRLLLTCNVAVLVVRLPAVLRFLEEDADGLDGVLRGHAAPVEHDDVARHPAIRLLAEHGVTRSPSAKANSPFAAPVLLMVFSVGLFTGTFLVLFDRVLMLRFLGRGFLDELLRFFWGSSSDSTMSSSSSSSSDSDLRGPRPSPGDDSRQ